MKMIKFRKHIPAYCRSFDEEEDEYLSWKEYESLQDILGDEDLKIWVNDNFKQFSLSSENGYTLMVEQKDGKCWVLGCLDQDIPELPSWVYKEENKDE